MMELKLDPSTMFEWQKCSQKSADVPHYSELLEVLNLCAQASETYTSDIRTPSSDTHPAKKSQPNKPKGQVHIRVKEFNQPLMVLTSHPDCCSTDAFVLCIYGAAWGVL